jgi:hypothetical protein
VAYPWAEGNDRIPRGFNGLKSVAIHQRADISGNHKYCILTFERDWCNGEPTMKREIDVSHDGKLWPDTCVLYDQADNDQSGPSSTSMSFSTRHR